MLTWTASRFAFCLALLLPACAAQPGSADLGQSLAIPVIGADGGTTQLQARLCRPASGRPARLAVINHGSPATESDRPRMLLGRCGDEAAQWFLTRNYAVAFALRRGYGSTGGAWAESYGPCRDADYVHAGLETARDIDAVVQAATALPGIQPSGVVVVGQSAGGWGTIAYGSQAHPNVSAMVVMAGGRGGHQDGVPNRNCHSDRLAEAAGQYGATARTPMLWIYAANDSFFAPKIAAALHRSFTGAGGAAQLEQPGPFGNDGHRLFFGPGGSKVWGPMVDSYLAQRPGAV